MRAEYRGRVPPSVLHLSTYDANGGAARAAYALHRSMVDQGLASTLRVAHKTIDDDTIEGPKGLAVARTTGAQLLDQQAWRLQRTDSQTWRSPALVGSISAREINATDADVVNLHWVTDGFLSIKEIGRITKPVVWSLVDMWPFAGTEHYGADTLDARWRTGYTKANRAAGESGLDMDRLAWQRKRRLWTRPMTIVAASTWMRERVAASALLRTWPVRQVPHVVDTTAFHPVEQSAARERLGLPPGVPLILFLSSAGVHDARKGWDLLERALPNVQARHPDVEVLIAGPIAPDFVPSSDVPLRWLGHISGNESLSLLYSAADVSAVPSREDNMPLAAMEAQTCGRPVVAFRIGGLPDIVAHQGTGYLAEPFDIADLAHGVIEALDDSRHERTWAHAARARALATWSPTEVVKQYIDAYDGMLA